MPYLIPIGLLGWIPLTLALFAVLSPVRAVTASIVGAWLILPPSSIALSGLPDYDKSMAATVGIWLSTLILQPNRLLGFRFRWYDLVVLGWCVCPFVSSVQNGLGVYDGLSSLLTALVRWALPYFIGRLYLGTLEDLRVFVTGAVIGGMIYILPTVFEIRMSPLLRWYVYGFSSWGNSAAMRMGGYRPFVFLTNGLEHGMWMTVVSLMAIWLWRSGTMRRVGPLPMGTVALPCLLIVTVICRSSGALFLLIAGISLMWISTKFHTKLLLYALLLIAPVYYTLRIPNLWSGDNLVSFINDYYNPERAESLGYRFACENKLVVRALQQPLWGWAGWGRSHVIGPDGRDQAPTDGMWIVHLGQYGFAGLLFWTTAGVLPTWFFLRRFPTGRWTEPEVAPAAVVAVLLGLYQVDCLVNGFLNLPLLTAAGGLICLSPSASRWRTPAEQFAGLPLEIDGRDSVAYSGPETGRDDGPARPVPQCELADRYLELARSLRGRGSPQEIKQAMMHACSILATAAAAHPDSEAVQKRRWDCANDLAWYLLNMDHPEPEDLEIAVQLATDATHAVPTCATYWNTLGAALCAVGDPHGSISATEQSMSLSGGGTAYDFLVLALAHGQLDETDSAFHWLETARSWITTSGSCHRGLNQLEAKVTAELASRFGTGDRVS